MLTSYGSADDALLRRVLSEYQEMPGLRVTLQQAGRLFGASEQRCAAVLEELVARKVLRRSPDGMYLRPSDTGLKRTA